MFLFLTFRLQQRDEMIREVKRLSRLINEKEAYILKIKGHDKSAQKSACSDVNLIKKINYSVLKELEISRECPREVDQNISKRTDYSSSDSETELCIYANTSGVMSKSLVRRGTDTDGSCTLMSTSLNETLLTSEIECYEPEEFTGTVNQVLSLSNNMYNYLENENVEKIPRNDFDIHITNKEKQPVFRRLHESVSDPLLRLKYNLAPNDRDMKKIKASRYNDENILSITSNIQISTDASEKVNGSFHEIENNRQLHVVQQKLDYTPWEKLNLKHHHLNKTPTKCSYFFNSPPIHMKKEPTLSIPMSHQTTFKSLAQCEQSERPLSEGNSESSFEGNTYGGRSDEKKEQLQSNSDISKEELLGSIQCENSIDEVMSWRNKAKHQRPLTRYMPILTCLNLKQHIESAGHQIELCRHIFIDSSTCKG